MRKTFTDQERADIARGWARSGLPQDQYAASYGVTGRALRGWMVKFAPSAPPLERVEAIVVEMMQRLQIVLDGVRAGRITLEDRAEDRACSSASPSTTVAAVVEAFRPEGQPEVQRPHHAETDAAGRSGSRRRGMFFQDFHSE